LDKPLHADGHHTAKETICVSVLHDFIQWKNSFVNITLNVLFHG